MLMKSEGSGECHQTLSSRVGSGHETSSVKVICSSACYLSTSKLPSPYGKWLNHQKLVLQPIMILVIRLNFKCTPSTQGVHLVSFGLVSRLDSAVLLHSKKPSVVSFCRLSQLLKGLKHWKLRYIYTATFYILEWIWFRSVHRNQIASFPGTAVG